jgi:hypothetical protein
VNSHVCVRACVRACYAGAGAPSGVTCSSLIATDPRYRDPLSPWQRCECELEVRIDGLSGKDVFVYYGLDKYYQNQRRYANSRDDLQLRSLTPAGVETYCAPLTDDNGT